MKVKEKFTVWQLAALTHPHNGEEAPDPACIHGRPGERSVILTCDIDDETMEIFGGPVWHVSVFPPVPGQSPGPVGQDRRRRAVRGTRHQSADFSSAAADDGR